MDLSRIAVIGLGAMGGRIGRRLLAAGHDVTVWNRTPGRVEPLRALGATVADSPAAAVSGADVVITMVADAHALRAVTEGPEGVAAGLSRGTILVEMSTVGPPAIARLAGMLADGVHLLDAPVLGSVAEADSGTLRILASGEPDAVAKAEPVLSTLGTVVHVGEAGAGAAAKLVANGALVGMLAVLGEVISLADGLHLTREATFEILAATPLAAQAQRRRPTIEAGEYLPRFALSLARKDVDLILTAADDAGRELPVARAVRGWLRDAEAAGLADRDYTAVLGHITSSKNGPKPNAIAVRP